MFGRVFGRVGFATKHTELKVSLFIAPFSADPFWQVERFQSIGGLAAITQIRGLQIQIAIPIGVGGRVDAFQFKFKFRLLIVHFSIAASLSRKQTSMHFDYFSCSRESLAGSIQVFFIEQRCVSRATVHVVVPRPFRAPCKLSAEAPP